MLNYFLSCIDDPEDRQKFDLLYKLYLPKMQKIACAFLRQEDDAMDALQDALKSLVIHIEKIGDPFSKETKIYITKIAKSAATDLFRKRKREAELIDPHANLYIIPDSTDQDTMANETFDKERYDQVVSYMRQMNAIYRDVLIMYYVNKLKAPEIAISLSLKLSTTKSRLRRGKAILRQEFPEVML